MHLDNSIQTPDSFYLSPLPTSSALCLQAGSLPGHSKAGMSFWGSMFHFHSQEDAEKSAT